MANYCCVVRTNYFRVKDEDKFKELMSRAYASEDQISVWEKTAVDGTKLFGFGCYSGIGGVRNAECDEDDDADETAYDEFIDGLQTCVASGDAIIIMESGNEKLRYITGLATVITENDCQYLDIVNLAVKKGTEMLSNSDWTTTCWY